MIDKNLRRKLRKVRLSEREIDVFGHVDSATSKVYERYYPKPGWQLVEKLYMASAYKLDALWYECGKYDLEIIDLTVPLSKAEKQLNRAGLLWDDDMQYKQLNVLVVNSQLRVSKAQLARMLGKENELEEPETEENSEPTVRKGGIINGSRKSDA